jgi:membrane protein
MAERRFLTGFVLPLAAAFAVAAATGPRHNAAPMRPSPPRRQSRHGLGGGRRPDDMTAQTWRDDGRGRMADEPQEIPKSGWRDILWRTWEEVGKDHISIIAAGVAFYAMLAIFPALTALVSIYGLISDPMEVTRQIEAVANLLPEEAQGIIADQLASIASQPKAALGFSLLFSLGFALWSASAGVRTLMDALNLTYDETERRGYLAYYGTALLLTLGAIVMFIVAGFLVAALPAIIHFTGLPPRVETTLGLLRWPLAALAVVFSLSVLYRFGPSRERARWQWVSWGAVIATGLWLVSSLLFSWYVSYFGNYNKTYGALGAVIVLLMWLYISAYVILFGAELNAEMEHQTARDTTVRRGAPMGQREAYVADTVGASP